jgi:hypothetical protein
LGRYLERMRLGEKGLRSLEGALDIVIDRGAARLMTEKDAAMMAGPQRPGPASGEIITAAAANARVATLRIVLDIGLLVLAAAAFAGGIYYWASAEDNFEKSEILPFPFVLAAMMLGLFALLRWLRRRRPLHLDEIARKMPPPGRVEASDNGLTIGSSTFAWADVRCTRIGVVSRTDDGGPGDYMLQWAMIDLAGAPTTLDANVMRGGVSVLNVIYRRCVAAPTSTA